MARVIARLVRPRLRGRTGPRIAAPPARPTATTRRRPGPRLTTGAVAISPRWPSRPRRPSLNARSLALTVAPSDRQRLSLLGKLRRFAPQCGTDKFSCPRAKHRLARLSQSRATHGIEPSPRSSGVIL